MVTRLVRRCCPLLFVVMFLPSPALAAFVTLSGTVTDHNGAGIFGVQINFVDSCTHRGGRLEPTGHLGR